MIISFILFSGSLEVFLSSILVRRGCRMEEYSDMEGDAYDAHDAGNANDAIGTTREYEEEG